MSVQKSLQRDHASSIAISLVINGLLIFGLLTLVNLASETPVDTTSIRLSAQETVEEVVEEPPPLEEIDPLDNLEEITFETDFSFESPTDTPLDSQDVVVDAVSTTDVTETVALMSDISSVVTMSNVMIGRTAAGRKAAIGKYGGGLGGVTEPAVMRALEWLAKVQAKTGNDKGAWLMEGEKGKANAGMTGLALLTFLAHGETPSSKIYGENVALGIRYLIDNQDSTGIFQPAGSHTGYGHAMATYAIAEAYTMTGNVLLEEPLERALKVMFDGMNSTGGYDYNYAMTSKKSGGPRSDNSLNAWHVQAMKAAKISGLGGEQLNAELQKAMDGMLAVSGKLKDGPGRGFAYSNSKDFEKDRKGVNNKLLSAAGLLCLHLSGRGNSREARDTLDFVQTFTDKDNIPEWEKQTIGSYGGEINHWYYTIQAFFHDNPEGRDFKKYMAGMARALVGNQQSDGRWVCFTPNGKKHGPVYNTTMAALALMVYYRHLPTTQAENIKDYPSEEALDAEEDDVKFSI